ncbi:MAG TPA: tetratricopeptide repeat protein [Chloroflexia bacterium]|jgi:tetratricopeptide (TPR) repeat protein
MPARFALTIGINYRDSPPGTDSVVQARAGLNPLSYAEADAEELGALLESDGYEVVKLIGATATRARIIEELTELNRKASLAGQDGLLLVHYSGHGAVDSQDGLAFLLPADGDPEKLMSTAIPLEDLPNRFLGRAQSALVLLDCCHSGYAVGFKGPDAASRDVQTFVTLAGRTFDQARQRRLTFAACAGEQLARERENLAHGIFTYYVLDHLRTSNDQVNDASLYQHLALKMPSEGVPAPVRGGSPQQGLLELRPRRVPPQAPDKPLLEPPLLSASMVTPTRRASSRLSPRARAELFQLLIKTVFTENDLSDLAFYADLDYAKLEGTNLRSNLRSLIAQAEKSGYIRQLRAAIQQLNEYPRSSHQPQDARAVAYGRDEPSTNQVAKRQTRASSEAADHVRLGQDHFDKHHYEAALAEYGRAIELDPTCVAAYNGRGDVYLAQYRYDYALAEFNQAIEADPKDAAAHRGLGDVYLMKNRYEEALAEFNRAIELDPKLAESYNDRGNLYYIQKQYDKALSDYDRAIELDPSLPDAYNGRGNTYIEQKKYDEALGEFNRVIELDPKGTNAYAGRGRVYYDLEQYDQALAEYNRSIELDPRNATNYNNRGALYYSQGKYEEALAEYNRAIELDPKRAQFYSNRGNVYNALERLEDALADFNRAIELDPSDPGARVARNYVYELQGKRRKAASDEKPSA